MLPSREWRDDLALDIELISWMRSPRRGASDAWSKSEHEIRLHCKQFRSLLSCSSHLSNLLECRQAFQIHGRRTSFLNRGSTTYSTNLQANTKTFHQSLRNFCTI